MKNKSNNLKSMSFFLILLIVSTLIISCIPSNPNTPINPGGGIPIVVSNATLWNNMLSFPTDLDFYNTLESIDNAEDNYTGYDAHMNRFGGNIDFIDDFLDENGIDEDVIYTTFENKFGNGFKSMRKEIQEKEDVFLENGGEPESGWNPENINIIFDDAIRTLLNKDGAVRINNVIFKFFDNGVTYAIKNGDIDLFNKLNRPDIYPTQNITRPYKDWYSEHEYTFDQTNVVLLTPYAYCGVPTESLPGDNDSYCNYVDVQDGGINQRTNGAYCKLWYKKMEETKNSSNDKKYLTKIGVFNTFIFNIAIAKVVHYKKKKNGKWKRSRANLSAKMVENGCSEYNKEKGTKYRKRRRVRQRQPGDWVPIVGQGLHGVYYILANASINDYYRYFLTASNNGNFYGDFYINGTNKRLEAIW